jgi:hypothetical protein
MNEGTAPIELKRIPDRYRAWNAALIEELFPRGRYGTHVYLSVHDGLLEDIGVRCGLGGRDAFVNAVLEIAPRGRPFFRELSFLWEIWDDSRRGDPPFVAGLALAVLAAGDMETDANATQANYYVRLNSLLGGGGRDRPEQFEDTVHLWTSLRDWLVRERRGELVLRGIDGPRPYVGAVTSQCLVRSCDIVEMRTAVRTYSGHIPETLSPEDALPGLARWLAGSGAQSRLARILGPRASSQALQQAAEALCDLLESANRSSQDEGVQARVRANVMSPAPVLRATLAIRPNRYPNLMWKRAEWLLRIPAPTDAEESQLMVQLGDRVLVASLDVREPASYDAVITASEATQLYNGKLKVIDEAGADITPHFEPVSWFEDGALRGRAGSWNLVASPAADTPLTVVAQRCALLDELRAAARDAGVQQPSTDHWPGPDVFAAHSVLFEAGASLPFGIAIGDLRSSLRMSGGLLLARRVYLRGALPTIVASDSDVLRVYGQGATASSEFETTANAFTNLDLGESKLRLECNGATAELVISEPRWKECRAADFATLDRDVLACAPTLHARGAAIEVIEERHVIHVRPGQSYRLVTDVVRKGQAPTDGGVEELLIRSRARDFVLMGSARPSGPLPRAECFDRAAGADEESRPLTDRLLEFISARSEGSVELVRSFCGSVAEENLWHGVLSTLEDLGHLDVGWDSRRWFAAPGVAAPRAANASLCTFVGIRARETLAVLVSTGIRAVARHEARARPPCPTLLIAPTDDVLRASATLERLGVRVLETSPAFEIAAHTKDVGDPSWWSGQEFTPAARVRASLERWFPEQLVWRGQPDGITVAPALYRWRERGVRMHYFTSRNLSCSVRDFVALKWLLAPRDRSYLIFDPRSQTLSIPAAMGLPRLLRRACALASGLPPKRLGRALVYEGIPLSLARTVAVRLHQSRAEGLW